MPVRRHVLLTILAALAVVVSLGAVAPTATEAATPRLKAVVIVGPSGSMQASNLADGEEIARTAASHGMDVRRVFHPYATWSRVLANIQGASVVAYLGHGNGWPSPYAPFQTNTKDGFGLNPYDGASAHETKYYGEGPIGDTVRLAANAVVLLNHLCYASGNSEPGHAAPTTMVAKERVDNYAAGFLRAGARAVFAYGHQDVSDVIDALYTTNATVDQIFMGRGYIGGRDIRFSSVRSQGRSVHMDPASATTFLRSVVGDLAMTASQVVGPPPGTEVRPASFVVPGAASVIGIEPVYQTPGGTAISQLDPGTKVRLAEGPVTVAKATWYRLSSPTTYWMRATSLQPEDSTPPRVDSLTPAVGWLSPNGDGVADTLPVTATFSETGSWRIRFRLLDGTNIKTFYGSGTSATGAWNGMNGTTVMPDGQYRVAAMSTDAWGNASKYRYGTVWIDTVAPAVKGVTVTGAWGSSGRTPAGETVALVSPNGDRVADGVTLKWSSSEAGTATISVTGAAGVVRSYTVAVAAGAGSLAWDGKSNAGAPVPDGTYRVSVRVRDAAGNLSASRSVPVLSHTGLASPVASPAHFYNRDLDALAPATMLGFTLTKPATVNWQLLDPAGAPLAIRHSGTALAAGSQAWSWDGRTSSKTFAPDGAYTMLVTATTSAGTVSQRVAVYNSALRISPSLTTAARGQVVTVTLVTAEPLSANPTLTVAQPGLASYRLATTKVSASTYRVSWTLRTGGTTGVAKLTASGVDVNGAAQSTNGSLTIK